jgi:hypothetical protein
MLMQAGASAVEVQQMQVGAAAADSILLQQL